MTNKVLTREMLKDMGITSIDWCEEEQQWWINRLWIKVGRCKDKRNVRMRIVKMVTHHKYAPDKTYEVITFGVKGKQKCISLARVIYAWFIGDVPADMDVDHIDNDPFNNRVENLQLLTREENLRKRYQDHPDKRFFNQHTYDK